MAEGRRPKAPLPLEDLNVFLLGSRKAGIRDSQPLRDLGISGEDGKKSRFGGPPQRFCFSLRVEPKHLYVK